jgi:membrane associated rhomboid family serine protease
MFPLRDHNPSERTPYVTVALIVVNVAVFLLVVPLYGDERALMRFYLDWALVPARVSAGGGYDTFLTSMFLHGGLLHLGGNMLFLWIFGDNLEDHFGHAGFLGFYLAAGVGAGFVQYLADPASTVPMVGASGAISGVMGGYLLLFPRARVDVLVIIVFLVRMIALPAWIMLGVWFGLQLFSGWLTLGSTEGGVAYLAHAGGFVCGLALTLPYWARAGGPRFWARLHGQPPHPPTRVRDTTIPRVPRRK